MDQELMQFVNRSEAPQNNQEIPTSYEWVLEFTHKPNIVFMPQDSLHEVRLKSVGLDYKDDVDVQTKTVRGGFEVKQPGLVKNSGVITLNYQDFEDQAIAVMMQDWAMKCNNRRTHRSAHKRDIYADIVVYRLNSFRKKICKWICETCIPQSADYGDDEFTSEKRPLGDAKLTLSCEFMDKKPLNLV